MGDKFGRSPLMYCVLSDRLECAELIIKAGADVNKKDIGGRTALHWAAHKVPSCKIVVVTGFSINRTWDYVGNANNS